jgi:hypothetical protein
MTAYSALVRLEQVAAGFDLFAAKLPIAWFFPRAYAQLLPDRPKFFVDNTVTVLVD